MPLQESVPIELTFTFSREDYLHFVGFWLKRNKETYIRYDFQKFCLFLGGYLILFLLLKLPTWFAAALAAFLAGICTAYLYWARNRRLRRVPDKVLGERLARIGPEGIFGRFPLREVLSYWKGVTDIAEDDDYLFFFTGRWNAHVIPKRAFQSPEELEQFRISAKSYWASGRA